MVRYCLFGIGLLIAGVGSPALAGEAKTEGETKMASIVKAGFEITRWEETDLADDGVRVYRTEVDKTFTGDMEGTSRAWLTMTVTPSGPAAYSGFELLEVSIGERSGTFVLDHHATMDADGQQADWRIMPDSGTGDLADIAGHAEITRHDDGSHTMTLHLD